MSWRLLGRIILYTVSGLVLLLVSAFAGMAYLLHTPQGSHWLLERARLWVPGELHYASVEGRLAGPLELRGLVYRDGDLSLQTDRIYLDWLPSALLDWRFELRELSLRTTRLHLPQADPEPAPAEPFRGIQLPLEVWVQSLLIEDFQFFQAGSEQPQKLERLSLRAQARGQQIELEQLELAAFDVELGVSGKLELVPGFPLELKDKWRYRLPEGPLLEGDGELNGNLQKLHVAQRLAPPLAGVLDATLFELQKALRWESRLELDGTELGVFAKGFPARLSGRLQSRGSLERLQADGRFELSEPSLGNLQAEIQSTYEAGELKAQQLLITGSGGLRLEGQGQYRADADLGMLNADLKWEKLRWPLIGKPVQFYSQDGSLQLQGRPEDYRYRLDLDAQLPDLPPAAARLSAAGNGNLQGLHLEQAAVVMQEGVIEGQGELAWAPDPQWRMELQGKDINPGRFYAELPGRLALSLSSEGQLRAQKLQAELTLRGLDGELRGYPVQAVGKARLEDRTAKIESLLLTSGINRADVKGTAGEQLDLAWSLQAPELETLWPDLAGSLNGQGKLAGKAEMPHIEGKLTGKALTYRENRIGELEADVDLDLAGSQRVELTLNATGLALGEQIWDGLRLNASGVRTNHRIALKLSGKQVPQANLELRAALSPDYLWAGTLQGLSLELPKFGGWALESPVGFTLSKHAQVLQSACLKSAAAALCGSFKGQTEKGWEGALQASRLPFALVQPWLPEEIQISGYTNLTAVFSSRDTEAIRGDGHLDIPEGRLTFELAGEPQSVDFSGGRADARLDQSGGRAELELPLSGLGGIEGRVELPGLQPANLQWDKQAMQGRLKTQLDDLGMLSLLLPNVQNISGAVKGDFKLGGTLAEPALQGDARLQGGGADIPALGLALRELKLQLLAEDLHRVSLTGSARSGKGNLELDGQAQLLGEQGYPVELRIKGKNWVVIDVPEAEVHASPDLVLKHTKARTDLEGDVHIPYARIRPREMPESAVSGSPDLVIVGEQSQTEEQADPRLHAKIRLSFGERVSFEGMGFKGKLSGNLMLVDEPGRPVTGRGRLGVLDGTYTAYGQDLKIERGYALFADSPVDNPGLDVRAVRKVEDVTAGLRVTGTLKKPQLSLFSTPAMGESDILSYLLTGRPPGESSGENVGLSTALQAAGAGSLASELGRQFGLEELRVDTSGSLEEASVVAGTYLSPRLYVQYVNELATRQNKLRLRYDLSKRFQIQTETGQSHGVDLFYTIER